MSQDNYAKWARSCITKKRYSSYEFIQKVIKDLKQKRDVDLYSYRCGVCESWHLTKAPPMPGVVRYNRLRVC